MSESKQPVGPDFATGFAVEGMRDAEPVAGRVGEVPAVLVKRGARFYLVGAECTHYHAPLAEGLVVGDTIRCPWHHACFRLTDGALLGPPALADLPCWRAELREGRVYAGEPIAPGAPTRPPRNPVSVLIVGAGAAGEACATALRRNGYDGPVRLIGDEAGAPVDRPNLSKDYLAGQAPEDWLPLRTDDWFRDQSIELHRNTRVVALDWSGRRVRCADGQAFDYGALVLATGCRPRRLRVPGFDQPHVHVLRTTADARAIIAAVERGARRACVIGASFIGLEVAASLRARGLEVSVVAPEARPMETLFGARLGEFLRDLHQRHGVTFALGCKPTAIEPQRVVLDDGASLPAELVVAGVGVEPDVELARAAGLALDRGVVVDERLRTSAPEVYAAGDIAAYPGPLGERLRIEHWVVAQRQGVAAARNLLGWDEPYRAVPFFWSQHYDVTLAFVGHARPGDAREEDGDPGSGDYACRFVRDGRPVALLTLGRDRQSLAFEAELETSTA